MIIESLCADDTFAFGKKLGEAAEPGTVYTLVGDLGVGKTVTDTGTGRGAWHHRGSQQSHIYHYSGIY